MQFKRLFSKNNKEIEKVGKMGIMKKADKGLQKIKKTKSDRKYGQIQLHTAKFDILKRIGQDKKAEKFIENLFFKNDETKNEL